MFLCHTHSNKKKKPSDKCGQIGTDSFILIKTINQHTNLAWKGKLSVKIRLDISVVKNALKLYISSKKTSRIHVKAIDVLCIIMIVTIYLVYSTFRF